MPKIQSHQVKAADPDSQGLVTPREDAARQVIELLAAALLFALVALTVGMTIVQAPQFHFLGATVRAAHPVRPAQFSHGLVTLFLVD